VLPARAVPCAAVSIAPGPGGHDGKQDALDDLIELLDLE
jgi:hypothetical protein